MKAYADRGDIVAANSIFNTAMSVGIAATLAMFTILIVGYGKLRKPDEAYRVFTRMRDAGIRPDGPVVDALASAYLYSGKRTEAREIILRNWSAIAPVQKLGHDLRGLNLKMLFYALRGLSGAQRKGGRRPMTEMRRALTRELVRRVLSTWKGDTRPPVPRKPVRKLKEDH